MRYIKIFLLLLSLALCPLALAQDAEVQKIFIEKFPDNACKAIITDLDKVKTDKISNATQYYTPIYSTSQANALTSKEKQTLLEMEGNYVAGNILYSYSDKYRNGVVRQNIPNDKFGIGSVDNALVPCRTIAANRHIYDIGTVIFIPGMAGKICPQSHTPVDGCFLVGDVGGKITEHGHFDIFAGECMKYNFKSKICEDKNEANFSVPAGSKFYIVPNNDAHARDFKNEIIGYIRNGWK